MTTKKLLAPFDKNEPEKQSSDFLIVSVMNGPELLGLKTKKSYEAGMVVYVGKEITANDLFAKLVDSGQRVENVTETLTRLEMYIQMLQEFRIGNIVTVQAHDDSTFKLVKLFDAPPMVSNNKLP